jgi:hypothetical protein
MNDSGACDRERVRWHNKRSSIPWIVSLFCLTAAIPTLAQETVVTYDIQVDLNTASRSIVGRENIRWLNTTDTPADELRFHLYLNAFSSERSTFMRESKRGSGRDAARGEVDWGWITLNGLEVGDGIDLHSKIEFVRPDDDNDNDFTVVRVALPEEVQPGAWIDIDVEFTAQLPEIIARTGVSDDFYMVGQWFPKLGVFEGQQGWNCHQFHANSEFFADFGDYEVEIITPNGWIVGATGEKIRSDPVEGSAGQRQRVLYHAKGVHDFAWCAAPPDLVAEVEESFLPGRDVPLPWLERASHLLGLSTADLELPPTQIHLVLPHSQSGLKERILNTVRLAIAWFGLHYGPYPYPQVTVVSPPLHASNAAGMEYPTLITTGADASLTLPLLRGSSLLEAVTVHEFGHQYFYGLAASNEFEQAWLDEGLTSYAEVECLEAIIRDRLAPWIHAPIGFWARERIKHSRAAGPVRIDQAAWEFRHFSEYGGASYTKAALVMKTLEGLIGSEVMARALRDYVDRYRFAHPKGDDLFIVIEETAGRDLSWFVDQAVHGDETPDWTILRVQQARNESERGMTWDGQRWVVIDQETQTRGAKDWSIKAEIGRAGDFQGPVEVQFTFQDGQTETHSWDGQARWTRIELDSELPVAEVVVDPDGQWMLETNREDNYWRRKSDSNRRPLWWTGSAARVLFFVALPWS